LKIRRRSWREPFSWRRYVIELAVMTGALVASHFAFHVDWTPLITVLLVIATVQPLTLHLFPTPPGTAAESDEMAHGASERRDD
jgi:hypothetical protein